MRCLEPSGKPGYFFADFIPRTGNERSNVTVDLFAVAAPAGSSWQLSRAASQAVVSGIHEDDLRAAYNLAREEGRLLGPTRWVDLLPPSSCSPVAVAAAAVGPLQPPRLLYMFMFNDEFDLLDLIREELDGVADVLVAIESNSTHSGKSKPLHFARSGLGVTFPGLVGVEVLDLPESMDPRDREVYQRDAGVLKALAALNARPEDLVLVTDINGIVSAESLRLALRCASVLGDLPIAFHVRHHVYNLNWARSSGDGTWGAMEGPRLVRASMLLELPHSQSTRGASGPSALSRAPQREVPTQPFAIWRNAGWHLSWFGSTVESLMAKAGTSTDQERNPFPHLEAIGMPYDRAFKMVERMIATGKTLWGEQLRWMPDPPAPGKSQPLFLFALVWQCFVFCSPAAETRAFRCMLVQGPCGTVSETTTPGSHPRGMAPS